MSLQRRLQLYLFLLHALFFALALVLMHDRPFVVVGIEIGLIVSFFVGNLVLKKALLPLGFVRQFQDLLHDENYAARIKLSSNPEANELATLFNRMLDALYQERLRLGEQRGFLDQLLEATPGAVIVFDFDGKVSLCNAFSSELFGSKIQLGKRLDVSTFGSVSRFIDDLQLIAVGHSEVLSNEEGRRFRCQRSEFVDRGFRREFLLIDEITEELASSERATYEKLVRVLAHEVNNTVAATGSVLESLLFYREQLRDEDSQDFSTAIVAVQKRNTNLAKFIERFTQVVKMPDLQLEPCDLSDMLDTVLVLYRQRCQDSGIALEWGCRDALPLQMLDRHLVEQALMNIVKNAIEAVEAAQKNADAGPHFVRIDLRSAIDSVPAYLSICDSGNGLKNISTSQLFTPFFTTKKGGQGIGLMFVREVFNRHGFVHRLRLNSEGQTQFDILLEVS
nr:ATP-binding protein [uncultured Undibacterium sp.]